MPELIFWRLEDAKTGAPVTLPQRGPEEHGGTVYGGRPPARLGSTGRILVMDEDDAPREFYPNVYGLAWKLKPELRTAAQLMITRGGSFAGHLGRAYLVADSDNTWRLLEAFPELFERYLEEVERAAEQY